MGCESDAALAWVFMTALIAIGMYWIVDRICQAAERIESMKWIQETAKEPWEEE